MNRTMILLLLLLILPVTFHIADTAEAQNWPQWRGPQQNGAAPDGNPPVEWSEDKNIRWKTNLPGKGYSTPAVWGDVLYLTTAETPAGSKPLKRGDKPSDPVTFIVLAVDRTDGKIKWQHAVREITPHEGMHQSSTWATCSPVTDGKHVYFFFGSQGLYCYTIAGELVWEKDIGDMKIRGPFGEGASPALYGNRLVVNWDHEGQSFIVALDSLTGEEIWRKNREERTSWMTPIIVEVNGKPQVIVSGTTRVRSYDLETGDLVWDGEGLTVNVVPSPVVADGVAYVISGFRGAALRAIRLSEAKGDIDGTPAVLWSYNQDTPYVPSPMLLNGLLYFTKDNKGILTCIDIATGKAHYSNQRLEGVVDMYASPTGVGNRLYISGRKGSTIVIAHGAEYSVMATNTLDDNFDASPVIIGDELYLRGHKTLYCVAK